jgi:Cu/Zn superoxide dismutase
MSLRILAATAALVLATSTLALAAGPVKFSLAPQNSSGETATVTMTEADGDTTVVVTTKGAPDGLVQPIHIHEGTCAKLNPKPAYPLTALQGGTSTTTLKGVSLASLETGDYAINVHHSTADVPTYYACGDIPKAK